MFSAYTGPILSALTAFPLVAFLFTIPYMIHCYRKFGSILWFRVLVVYSFILYLICAYFLVILPLPDREVVAALTTKKAQLIPFAFISDIIKNIPKSDSLITNKAFLQVVFNIVLTIPFGMYLHYYFELSFRKAIIYSFWLSLFFELTQLTGLYFIYPRSYRLFDVDDLFLNTLGGLLGYLLMYPVSKLLPTVQQLDEASYKKGEVVSWLRRSFSVFMDVIIFFVIFALLNVFFTDTMQYFNQHIIISVLIYLVLFTLMFRCSTPGMICTKLQIVNKDGKKARFYQIILRQLVFVGIYLVSPFVGILFVNVLKSTGLLDNKLVLVTILSILLLYALVIYLATLIKLIAKKELIYEKISNTKVISIVKKQS